MLLLTSSLDKVNIVTGSSYALDVHASYMDYASGVVTPGRTNTAVASITTSAVVGSPASATQRNVKWLTARNKDASNVNTITINHTDGSTVVQIFVCTLRAGETAIYNDQTGFCIMDATGRKRERSLMNSSQAPYFMLSPVFATANNTTVKTITSGSSFATYMGKAPRAMSKVVARVRVTTAMATITWGEVAIAKGTPSLGGNPTLTVVGYTDVSGVFNATGSFSVTIAVDPTQVINEGDDLWLLVGNAATTACVVRGQSIADDLSSGLSGSVASRPSTIVGTPTAVTADTTAATAAWVMLQV